MPIVLTSGLQVTNTEPVDSRFVAVSSAQRNSLSINNVYEGLVVFVTDTKKYSLLVSASNPLTDACWVDINISSGSQSITGSLTVTGGITGSLFGSASYSTTSSFAVTSSYSETSSYAPLYVLTSVTSSMTVGTASHVNPLPQTVYITNTAPATGFNSTASFYTDGGIRVSGDSYMSGTLYLNNLTVFGTQSINYITSSQFNVSTNIITVNTSTPAIRFGGLAVIDSGSTGTGLTGSILWDSEDNNWVYSNPSGSEYDGALFLVGPRNTVGLGNEVGINYYYAAIGDGGHHMTSSVIWNSGSLIRLETTTEVTGSLTVSQGITGSLFGTASYVSGSVFSSTNPAISASYAVTSSYAATSSYASNFSIGNTLTNYVSVDPTSAGINILASQVTGSYTSAFGKYTMSSGSNIRAGEFVTAWNGTTSSYYDNSTVDIGNTSVIALQSTISGNQVVIQTGASTPIGFEIKMLITYI